MCELFAVSSAQPMHAGAELATFWTHSERHADGWGIAWSLDGAPLVVKRPLTAFRDPMTRWLARFRGLTSKAVIAHVRRTSQGHNVQKNTHPFERELFGRPIVFAHNGDLPHELFAKPFRRYRPIGETDSEKAFCTILDAWYRLGSRARPQRLLATLAEVTGEIERPNRKFNYVLMDGDRIYCHWSGYVSLLVQEREVRVRRQSVRQVLIASQPVNDGAWKKMRRGEILVLESGQIVDRVLTAAAKLPPPVRRRYSVVAPRDNAVPATAPAECC